MSTYSWSMLIGQFLSQVMPRTASVKPTRVTVGRTRLILAEYLWFRNHMGTRIRGEQMNICISADRDQA